MERTLQLKDFIDFEENFEKMKAEIYSKNAKGKLVSEDFVQTFLKLQGTIDQLLARVGRKMVAVAQGSHPTLQNENTAKILTLLESLFVGNDEGQPPQLIEFLDQNKTDIMSKNDLNSETLSNKITGIAH